jgi:pilus assembly protein CpaC
VRRAGCSQTAPRGATRASIFAIIAIAPSVLIGQMTAGSVPIATPTSVPVGYAVPAGEMTHLIVGHSMFVNTQARLRRIYVSNPLVLDCYTASPHQIVVTAKATGVGTVVLWDENGASQVDLLSVDVDVEGLRKALKEALPGEEITVEGSEGRITLAGTLANQATADAALKLAALYAKDVASALQISPSQIKQVSLKVRIIEIDRSKLDQFGVNLFGIGTTTGASTTGQPPSPPHH